MVNKRVTVQLREGLQARPAALFVQEAGRFHSHVTLEKDGKVANVKSIMGVMSVAPAFGEEIVLAADGPDEQEALDTLSSFIENQRG
ncbi:HPr family phosphocarrier protein [Sporolactobacillus sp. THM19-2]|jgi:phosphotransferase system HPr (HPr) family protein|uniref:HPr family phosphocarrier protein n=1 Tax=Sporolactobacillus sp. THM19-2 TaxID=2511171 RepID=UPI001021DBD2|nr:HPr family phosphocarrier protein [Sporolactobacillus sp. THM19-2]RYL93627.1 HPr family phosphocarrier protein [Sporolactobacillus sp. THM19-2]